ncbi:hypothetical protein Tco_0175046 [Tanacetum coccineum]
MDQDSVHMVAASKVPMLKLGEYELWRIRMEQYIQMVDYSLWEVIKNGNAPLITKLVKGVETIIAPSIAEEKTKRRFGGNAATKKTRRNLLKQQYEKFTASSSEVLVQTFDRLQKLISQLEIHGESISQEDVNQNTSITNGAVNTAHSVTTNSTQATAINSTTINNLSDVVICAFFASQPNNPKLNNKGLQQINPGDLVKMDLRWQMAMLTMRARRFLKNTGRKLNVNVLSSILESPSNSEETMVLDMALLLVGYVKTFDEPAQLLRSSKPVKWLPTFIWGLDSPLPKRTTPFQGETLSITRSLT